MASGSLPHVLAGPPTQKRTHTCRFCVLLLSHCRLCPARCILSAAFFILYRAFMLPARRSPAVSRHLQRVYLTVLAGILVFAAGACWSGDFYSSQFKVRGAFRRKPGRVARRPSPVSPALA